MKSSQAKRGRGKVQLLRLEANKSRRQLLADFEQHISDALVCGIGTTDVEKDTTNVDRGIVCVFDWNAFPRNLRQQYYDALNKDFPGEFIYISASDDFYSLQSTCPHHLLLNQILFAVTIIAMSCGVVV